MCSVRSLVSKLSALTPQPYAAAFLKGRGDSRSMLNPGLSTDCLLLANYTSQMQFFISMIQVLNPLMKWYIEASVTELGSKCICGVFGPVIACNKEI
ncbi:hypothetical protein DPMN_051983 [Dreissena polymorpha]|uniref:Uncharacterized protein n=1 Tax=Dreissena polymorpha TaxID=45954 RepID=A0A9D4CKE4_DREPO|nr:hypothetical protein DPMN_051983 [Dreissena polymorpha]